MEKEEKLNKCKKTLKRNLLLGIIASAFITWLLYSLICLLARTDGGTSSFNSNHIIIIAGIFIGVYGTYAIGDYIIYLIKVWYYKGKE